MGAATRNHRACRILICIRACGQRYSQRVTEIRFGYAPLIPTASPKPRFSVSGKPNFAVRDSRGQKWRCRSNVVAETQIDRGTVGELIGPDRIPLLVRVRPAARIITENKRPTIWMGVRPAPPRIRAQLEIPPL